MTTIEAIRRVINYNWEHEKEDYEENPPDPGHEESHVFKALVKLSEEFDV